MASRIFICRLDVPPASAKNTRQAFIVGPRQGPKRAFRAVLAKGKRERRAMAEHVRLLRLWWCRSALTGPVRLRVVAHVVGWRKIDGPNILNMVADALVEAMVLSDDNIDVLPSSTVEGVRLCAGCPAHETVAQGNGHKCTVKGVKGGAKGGVKGCTKAYVVVELQRMEDKS